MNGLEDYEGLRQEGSVEGIQNEGLTDIQKEYMLELAVPASEWEAMQPEEQMAWLEVVTDRYSELGTDAELDAVLQELYGDQALELYQNVERVEAPNDMEQIDMVSDVLVNCEELKYENWTRLSDAEKTEVLNQLEEQIAAIECRPPCPVHFEPLEPNLYGGYRPGVGDIQLNNFLLANDYGNYQELIDTLIHEGRHAYQDYNINVQETHPRHSEVDSWRDTWGNGTGKWEYWNDCRTELGVRLYEQQSIEIDARNFAGDVINTMNQKQQA